MASPENLADSLSGPALDAAPAALHVDSAVLLLGAGVTTITHPLLYVKLLIQVASRSS